MLHFEVLVLFLVLVVLLVLVLLLCLVLVLENGKLNFETECLLVKCPCCPLRFSEKIWEKFRGHGRTGLP